VPLHTWLPDAMEGPTPVSALIHAATMVTAGVYLIARMHPLFELSDTAAAVGAVDRLHHAAGRRHDRPGRHRPQARHRLLDDVADRLHDHGRQRRRVRGRDVPPHDARLLQGAAVHGGGLADRRDGRRADLDRMGGFRRAMPFTFGCFIVGGLALSGVPPLSGFFSKDEILLVLGEEGGWSGCCTSRATSARS
jgi:NADH-quinone oxidoreductase subunit L